MIGAGSPIMIGAACILSCDLLPHGLQRSRLLVFLIRHCCHWRISHAELLHANLSNVTRELVGLFRSFVHESLPSFIRPFVRFLLAVKARQVV